MEKFKEIEAKALAGNYSAMSELANYYIQGNVVEKNIEEGINWYEKAIKAGDDFAPQTVNDIGRNLQNGDNGYEVNLSLALRCYKIAADAGNVLGMGNYAYCNYCGTGTEKNYQTAYEYWQKAADKGDAVCMNNVGFCYENGYGVEQDLAKSIEYYFNALENKYAGVLSPIETFLTNHDGFSDYMYKLGEMYYNGKSVEMNWDKAVEWYTKAAERGHADAMFCLGKCFDCQRAGRVHENKEKTVEWYTKAAENGHTEAMCRLAKCYECRQTCVEQSNEKAAEWYLKAAENGHVNAMYDIGDLFFCGRGVERNAEKGVEWYTKAAENGHIDAMRTLGTRFLNSKDISDSEAFKWFLMAAENGDFRSMEDVGKMYMNGQGVRQDYEKAVEWFVKASKRNYEARRILGLMYKTGNGVTKDLKEALRWYEMAGEERIVAEIKQSDDWKRLTAKESEESVDVTDAQAMCQLAMQYQYGENNMPKDRDKAIFWYQKSAMAGNSAALSFLNMLLSEKEAERADMQRREEDNRLAEMQRMLDAERRAKEEAERNAKEEAERRAMAERNAKEEAERRAKEEAEKRANAMIGVTFKWEKGNINMPNYKFRTDEYEIIEKDEYLSLLNGGEKAIANYIKSHYGGRFMDGDFVASACMVKEGEVL